MTKSEAARRYLQAKMDAAYTGLPGEAAEAHEGTAAELERRFPGVANHAMIGADQDFDKPLSAGLREHQRHLRSEHGIEQADVLAGRRELRGGGRRSPSPGPTRPKPKPIRNGARAGAGYYRAKRTARALGYGGGNAGSTALEAVGLGLGVILLYLVLSPNGSKAFSTLLNGVAGALRLFVAPVDPLNPPKRVSASSSSSTAPTIGTGPDVFSPRKIQQIRSRNPAFGPAPGLGSPLQPAPVGGGK